MVNIVSMLTYWKGYSLSIATYSEQIRKKTYRKLKKLNILRKITQNMAIEKRVFNS